MICKSDATEWNARAKLTSFQSCEKKKMHICDVKFKEMRAVL